MKPNKRIPLSVGASSVLTWFVRETGAQSKVFEPSLGLLRLRSCGFLSAYWKVPPTLHMLSMVWRSVRGFCQCFIESFRYSFPASTQVRSHNYKEAVYIAGTMLIGVLQLNLRSCFPVCLQLFPVLFLNPGTIRYRGPQICRELGLVLELEVWAIFTTRC